MFKEFGNPEEQDYDITSSLKGNEEEPIAPIAQDNNSYEIPDDIPEDTIEDNFMPEEEFVEDIPEDIEDIEMPRRRGR